MSRKASVRTYSREAYAKKYAKIFSNKDVYGYLAAWVFEAVCIPVSSKNNGHKNGIVTSYRWVIQAKNPSYYTDKVYYVIKGRRGLASVVIRHENDCNVGNN